MLPSTWRFDATQVFAVKNPLPSPDVGPGYGANQWRSVIALAVLYLWRRGRPTPGIDEQWRPRELRGAEVVYAETQFRIANPVLFGNSTALQNGCSSH
jgi:hypothetical protein